MNGYLKIFSIFFLCFPFFVNAQIAKNNYWNKVTLNHSINERSSVSFAPIVRTDADFGNYQNFSLDYAYKYKLNSIFTVQVLGRTWFLTEGRQRQFIWPQITAAKSFNNLKVSSYARWHKALDIDDVVDADFLRWKASLSWDASDKLQLFTGIEPWWRLDTELDTIQRTRYTLGAKYIISDRFSVSLDWWRQVDRDISINIFVPNLAYKI